MDERQTQDALNQMPDPLLRELTGLLAQLRLCDEFLYAASVDETFGLLDISAKREALAEAIEALDVPF